MKQRVLLCLLLLSVEVIKASDLLTIHNSSDKDVYGAIYYVNKKAMRATSVVFIPASSTVELLRPERKRTSRFSPFFLDREFVFSTRANDLLPTLKKLDLAHGNVGSKWGRVFYIVESQGKFSLYTQSRYKATQSMREAAQTIAEKSTSLIKKLITSPSEQLVEQVTKTQALLLVFLDTFKDRVPQIRDNPYKHQRAQVRVSNTLPVQEKAYKQKRAAVIKPALETLLNRELTERVPTIALVCSGGGYRAMLSTTGFFKGAADIGLMDSVTYISALSGSTWALGVLSATGMSINQLKPYLTTAVAKSLSEPLHIDESSLIMYALLAKLIYDQPITLVDLYGGLLANRLLRSFNAMRQRVGLSEQSTQIASAQRPFPIYTAVSAETTEYEWYEFTPYEIGSAWLGCYVPSWSFGRLFKNGISADTAPEQSFGFELGIFGSAFAAAYSEMYKELKMPPELRGLDQFVRLLLMKMGQERVTRGKVFNFAKGIAQSPMADENYLGLVDAGLDFNLPYPPISGERPERKADIIIFLDASDYSKGKFGSALRGCQTYAQRKGLAFPAIDYTDIQKRAVTVFKDEDSPETPVVVYLPLVRDAQLWNVLKDLPENVSFKQKLDTFDPQDCAKFSYCSTFNFKYTVAQVDQLTAQAEFNIRAAQESIIDAINWKVDQFLSG